MDFSEIYLPITKELHEVEIELKNVTKKLGSNSAEDIFSYFFLSSGKHLRPILALLSAGAVNNQLSQNINQRLTQLCVGIELIHSASLIHDDIIDDDLTRRGQQTLNKVYGNKMAVLAGDALYSRAFSIFSDTLPKEFSQIMGRVTESMSVSEILNAKYPTPHRETYLKIIEGKTAFFMNVCCRLGATLAGASEEESNCLANYGQNLGMVYQILDDYIDEDLAAVNNVTIEDAFQFASNAKDSIKNFKDSIYTNSLINLVNYVLDFYKPTAQNA